MVRLGLESDSLAVCEIFEDAKRKFANEKTFQWKGKYPNIENFQNDLKNNKVFVFEKDNLIIGTETLVFTPDPNYYEIEGQWLNNNPYLSIHRICTRANYYHQGVGYSLFMKAEEVAKENNIFDLRIDTHEGNLSMRSLLQRLGYIQCGKIILLNRDDLTIKERERIAYQKHLI